MRNFLAALFLLLFSGCSIHPLQDDVTDLPVVDIVHKVRCEARDAIIRHDVVWHVDPKIPGGRIYQFDGAAIAYTFTFSAAENNDASASGDLSFPIYKGTMKIALDVGEKKSRRGDRVFKIADNFADLRHLTSCDKAIVKESWRYPITGTTGLDEVIASFIKLTKLQEALSDVAEYTDTISFTTKINGSVNPSVSLIPGVRRLANARANASADREDVHKILVAIAAPLTPKMLAALAENKIVKVRIVDFVAPKVSPMAKDGTAATARSVSPALDAKLRALRSADKERAEKTQQDILDRLPPN